MAYFSESVYNINIDEDQLELEFIFHKFKCNN